MSEDFMKAGLPLPLEISVTHDGTVRIMGAPDGDADDDGRSVMIWPHIATMEDTDDAEEWAALIVAAVNGYDAALARIAELEGAERFRAEQYVDLVSAAREALKCMQFRTQSSLEFGAAQNALFSTLSRLARDGQVYDATFAPEPQP